MNRALQWKLIAGFLLVFVAGGITGAFVGGSYARHHFLGLHRPERIGAQMKERLRAELNLTPEQVAKISHSRPSSDCFSSEDCRSPFAPTKAFPSLRLAVGWSGAGIPPAG